MNALQKIIAEAKSLKKKYPKRFDTWKEYVSQASAIYASKHKQKSPVGKKKTVGKTGSGTHKDTKSHNVNIKVVSGTQKGLVHGWRKGGTAMIEAWEKKLPKFKNVRVTRIKKGSAYSKPGTFRHFSHLSGLFDHSVIKDIDSLKKEFYKLAKKYHPDAGGTNIQMQQLNAEYEKLFQALLNGSNLTKEEIDNEIVLDNAIREVIDNIISLENINIEVIGKWVWVSGNTYPVKDSLKKAGLVFIKKEGTPYWVYKGVPSSSRGGTSMDEIKKKYGAQVVMPKQKGKLTGIPKVKKVKLTSALKKLTKALNKR